MCTSPRTITLRRHRFDAGCGIGYMADSSVLSPYVSVDVPCGHCCECLKHRQRSVEIRFVREAQACNLVYFVTLTYDDDTMPLACLRWSVDLETGEASFGDPLPVVRFPYHKTYKDRKKTIAFEQRRKQSIFYSPKRALLDIPKRKDSNFYDFELPSSIRGCKEYMRITPSLCRKDVQLFLKRFRVAYERRYNESLPDWRYCLVGEYGSNTARPHYHLATFGLPQKAVYFLSNLWRVQYGFVFCERCNAVNADDSDGFQKLGHYLGKYVAKGDFELDSVRLGVAQRGRLCMSSRFGLGRDIQALRRKVLGFHLVPEYDPHTLVCKASGKLLNEREISRVCENMVEHFSLMYNNQRYPLPPSLKHYLFYHKDDYGNYRKNKIYSLALSLARSNIVALRQREFAEFFPSELDSEGVSRAASSFNKCSEVSALEKEKAFKKDSARFYYNSNF